MRRVFILEMLCVCTPRTPDSSIDAQLDCSRRVTEIGCWCLETPSHGANFPKFVAIFSVNTSWRNSRSRQCKPQWFHRTDTQVTSPTWFYSHLVYTVQHMPQKSFATTRNLAHAQSCEKRREIKRQNLLRWPSTSLFGLVDHTRGASDPLQFPIKPQTRFLTCDNNHTLCQQPFDNKSSKRD